MPHQTKQTKYDPDLLAAALEGYTTQKSQIEGRIADLRQRLGKGAPSMAAAGAAMAQEQPQQKKRHKISVEGRKRIAEAQRKRWAAKKQAETQASRPKVRTAGS